MWLWSWLRSLIGRLQMRLGDGESAVETPIYLSASEPAFRRVSFPIPLARRRRGWRKKNRTTLLKRRIHWAFQLPHCDCDCDWIFSSSFSGRRRCQFFSFPFFSVGGIFESEICCLKKSDEWNGEWIFVPTKNRAWVVD